MTLLDLFLKGGPLMFPLLALSFIALGISIGKYLQILNIRNLQKKITDGLNKAANPDEISMVIKDNAEESPLSVVVSKAMTLRNEEYTIVKDSLEATANNAIHKLEKGFGWLSTISAVAPLLGFLGTVTGMVKVFINIAAHSQQGIDIAMLAGGIWEAMITTVGGLVVGIPVIILYNDLVSHAENIAKSLQEQIDALLLKMYKK